MDLKEYETQVTEAKKDLQNLDSFLYSVELEILLRKIKEENASFENDVLDRLRSKE